MIEGVKEDKELREILSSFSCDQDEDIQNFLLERAVEFEKLSKTRTYLICDQEQLENEDEEALVIYGYISLALKVLTVQEEISNRMRKELDGFSAKIYGERINEFPCYLIGQLARNSKVSKEMLGGEDLIRLACDVIATSVESVGGRYILIECHDNEKLLKFYENNHFSEISRIANKTSPMVQMIRKIC